MSIILNVVGWPRSGNHYLSFLLRDVLNCSITTTLYKDNISNGKYTIIQNHLKAINYKKNKTIHIVRDPRDIAVSADKFWSINDLEKTLDHMINGTYLKSIGPWKEFVDGWAKINDDSVVAIRYEDLLLQTYETLKQIFDKLNIEYDKNTILSAISNQEFTTRKAYVEKNIGGSLFRSMRKGIIGDYKNYLTQEHLDKCWHVWYTEMKLFGYER